MAGLENGYVTELCEYCSKPIGYKSHGKDEKKGTHFHHACLEEEDLKARGYVPVGRMLLKELQRIAPEIFPPDKDDSIH